MAATPEISLDHIKNESSRFGRNAFIATVSKKLVPFVSPVTFNWFGEDLLTFLASNEQKVRNCSINADVNIHFPVSEQNNGTACFSGVRHRSFPIHQEERNSGTKWVMTAICSNQAARVPTRMSLCKFVYIKVSSCADTE